MLCSVDQFSSLLLILLKHTDNWTLCLTLLEVPEPLSCSAWHKYVKHATTSSSIAPPFSSFKFRFNEQVFQNQCHHLMSNSYIK